MLLLPTDSLTPFQPEVGHMQNTRPTTGKQEPNYHEWLKFMRFISWRSPPALRFGNLNEIRILLAIKEEWLLDKCLSQHLPALLLLASRIGLHHQSRLNGFCNVRSLGRVLGKAVTGVLSPYWVQFWILWNQKKNDLTLLNLSFSNSRFN